MQADRRLGPLALNAPVRYFLPDSGNTENRRAKRIILRRNLIGYCG